MQTKFTRDEAISLLKEHNKQPFHIQHAITVGKVLRHYAENHGYADEADFWEICGILHDIDFEEFPEEHCKACIPMLEKAGAEPEIIHAVCSHGFGICSDVEPEHEMEKFLAASDELTGLIGATALMRPSKSCKDMELSSLKKKFKDKKFAAGCSRDVIRNAAERMGISLEELMQLTLDAMKAYEDEITADTLKYTS